MTNSCRDDSRPDSDRPEWRHGGVSDRSGGRSSVAGADPASDEPNQLEWLHWVASRVAAEGAPRWPPPAARPSSGRPSSSTLCVPYPTPFLMSGSMQ